MLSRDEINEMARSEMVERIIELQENKRHSDFDLQEFAEWCPKNGWEWSNTYDWWHKIRPENKAYMYKTTSDLQIMWEIETGRKCICPVCNTEMSKPSPTHFICNNCGREQFIETGRRQP